MLPPSGQHSLALLDDRANVGVQGNPSTRWRADQWQLGVDLTRSPESIRTAVIWRKPGVRGDLCELPVRVDSGPSLMLTPLTQPGLQTVVIPARL